mmetsp:Transcript_34496/g.67521  ORF Transcript_34496/g.67521 Transcript_34496/m.67521 type:complete len:232 (-) Transcript_34496:264-959(-)
MCKDFYGKLHLDNLSVQPSHHVDQRQPPSQLHLSNECECGVECVIQQALDHVSHVGRARLPGALVHVVDRDALVGHRSALQHIQALAHIAPTQPFYSVEGTLLHRDPLRLGDLLQPRSDVLWPQRREAEPRAPRLERGDDLVYVVADEAKPRVCCVVLDHSSQRELRRRCHVVGLVQDDELEPRAKDCACAGEVLDLLLDNIDTALVRRVQLQRHALVLWAKDSLGHGEDR